MNPVFTALVPALQIHWGGWWDSGSGGSYAGNGGYGGYGGGSYGSGGGSWS
jgi:hypothetical protein